MLPSRQPWLCAPGWLSLPPLPPAKGRGISLPMDLDAHISLLLSSGASCVAAAQRNASNYKATTRPFPRVTPTANQWDYKNIIEKLQVGVGGHGSGWGGRCLRSAPSCAARALLGGCSLQGEPAGGVGAHAGQDPAQCWQHLSAQAVHLSTVLLACNYPTAGDWLREGRGFPRSQS